MQQSPNRAARAALTVALDVCVQGSTAAGYDQVAETVYDGAGRVSANRENGTATATFAYDDGVPGALRNGLLKSVTDANGNISTYGYDGYDRRTAQVYPDGTADGVAYDPAGNVMTETRRDGARVDNSYDALNRLTLREVSTLDPQPTTYTYDLLGRLTGASRGGSAPVANDYGYDALSRLVSTSASGAGGVHDLTMLYDTAGRRKRLTWGTPSTWGGVCDVTPVFHPASTSDRPVLSRMSAGEATGGVNPARCCSSPAANAAGVA